MVEECERSRIKSKYLTCEELLSKQRQKLYQIEAVIVHKIKAITFSITSMYFLLQLSM